MALQWPTGTAELTSENRPILGSRRLTTIRPPHISRSALAICLSLGVGYLLFADAFRVEFARKVPHSGTPEANPAVAA
jgi:hypothetical protein